MIRRWRLIAKDLTADQVRTYHVALGHSDDAKVAAIGVYFEATREEAEEMERQFNDRGVTLEKLGVVTRWILQEIADKDPEDQVH